MKEINFMSVRLSKKYGLNPSMVIYPICGNELSIAICGYLKGDIEAPKILKASEPCEDCKKVYITVVEVESETNRKPTGRRVFVPKEVLKVESSNGIVVTDRETFNKIINS